jgi:hypothetical protein
LAPNLSAREECHRSGPWRNQIEIKTPGKRQPSDTSAIEKPSNELVKLNSKLRWLGMEEEAQACRTSWGDGVL